MKGLKIMEKIKSFTIDHTKLLCGMYISRVDDDIVTYDIRTRRPNVESAMDIAAAHTIEHLFATYIRNSEIGKSVIYFGPMGCRTGFYLLLRNTPHSVAIEQTKLAFDFIKDFKGDIPGATAVECGNYLDHNLEGANKEAEKMSGILMDWNEHRLEY